MDRVLVVTVHFHDGRYHGRPEWPPSPMRLFQALVAGAARGDAIDADHREALSYLEQLDAPVIAAPVARSGKDFRNYVPNNDLDAALPKEISKQIDAGTKALADAVASIRAPKRVQPRLFDASIPLRYLYDLTDDAPEEAAFHALTKGLYQLGWGVDMAYAHAVILTSAQAYDLLATHQGVLHRPGGDGRTRLAVPGTGTLRSLEQRHAAFRTRFRRAGTAILFTQPPKALASHIAYDAPPVHLLFDLDPGPIEPTEAHALTVAVREALARKLGAVAGADARLVDRFVTGRGATDADKAARVGILPLPSIGHAHADQGVRRVLVTVPASCPIPRGYLDWALSGLEPAGFETVLTPADDRGMLRHYGVAEPTRSWGSVTPAALTVRARTHEKSAAVRLTEEAGARAAVVQALRHAGIAARAETIRVQREPFAAKGTRADAFAAPPRFPAACLWHVEIILDRPVEGPLVLGDGRYLGLGLMAPDRDAEPVADGVAAFRIVSGLTGDAAEATGAMRRAVMARVRDVLGLRQDHGLPAFFSGHEAAGGKAADGTHRHLAFACDGARLLVFAPHRLTRRETASREERVHLRTLARALAGLTLLRAGRAGLLALEPSTLAPADPLLAPARVWRSVTDYVPTRHAKRLPAGEALAVDIAAELGRLGLPQAAIRILSVRDGPRGGLTGAAELAFAVAVPGPILIGRDRHQGGGLFAGMAAAS